LRNAPLVGRALRDQNRSMGLITNDRGQLTVPVPRLQHVIAALLLAATAALLIVWIVQDPAAGADLPPGFRIGAAAFCGLFAVAFAWQSGFARPLVFDAQRAAIVRGERVVARFAEVQHVELLERRSRNHTHWRVRVCLSGSRRIDLGVQRADIDADLAAARVATALGKPVRHVVR